LALALEDAGDFLMGVSLNVMDDSREAGAEVSAKVICRHCDAVFQPTDGRTDFCCAGCEYVYRLIRGQNLDKFYTLRQGTAQPVGSVVFQPRDYRWLEGLGKAANEKADPLAILTLDVQGVSCVGCVWLIEKVFKGLTGARSIRVNANTGQIKLRWLKGAFDLVGFARQLQGFGYLLGPAGQAVKRESSRLVVKIGLSAALALNAMLFTLPVYLGMKDDFQFAGLFGVLAFVFASLSLVIGGSYFIRRSILSIKKGVLHIDLPISLGIIAAYAASVYAWFQGHSEYIYFDFVSTFIFLMLVGRWTQQVAVEKNRNHLLSEGVKLPPVSVFEKGGELCEETKAVELLEPGEHYSVVEGQAIPVCSKLVDQAASLGMDWISGESEVRSARSGQLIEAGAINVSNGEIRLEALESWSESILSKLLRVEPEEGGRDRLMEKIIRFYLIVVLLAAAVGGAFWMFFLGNSQVALEVFVSILVVSCPCALGVSLPLADEIAVAKLRRKGVYVRSESFWARLRRIRKVIFDKTGTLTLETLVLRNPEALRNLSAENRSILYAMVRKNRHPVSSCLREYLLADGYDMSSPIPEGYLREETGQGLEFTLDGHVWRLGRGGWAESGKMGDEDDRPMSDCHFVCDGKLVTTFSLKDSVREDACSAVTRLKEQGHEVFILSGDRQEKVSSMARLLGLSEKEGMGQLTPEEKARWIRSVDKGDTLMIGDGANDSLAFDEATCRGTPAIDRGLLEQKADFYFMGRNLGGILSLFQMAKAHRRAVMLVMAFAIVYNAIAVGVCLMGWMNPLLAAILMPISSLVSLGLVGLGLRDRTSSTI
jgi:Cu2+-exporting ATPase